MEVDRTPRHIVAVGGLVQGPGNRVLLIRGPRRGWEFPGGQVEEGESLPDALIREVQEETGVAVTVGPLVGVYSNLRARIFMFGFLCDWVSGEPRPCAEALEVEWVDRDQALARVTHPAIASRLRDKLNFGGQVVYRAYSVDPESPAGWTVHDERFV